MTTDAGFPPHENKEEPVVEAQGKEIIVLVTGYGVSTYIIWIFTASTVRMQDYSARLRWTILYV